MRSAKMEPMQTSSLPPSPRHPVLVGLVEALKIDLIVVPAVLLITTIFWIIGLGLQLPYSVIPSWAFSLWAGAHGIGVSTMGFEFSLPPTLLTLGAWLLIAFASRRMIRSIGEPDPDTSRQWWIDVATACVVLGVAYAGPLLLLSVFVGDADLSVFSVLRLLILIISALVCGYIWARGVEDIPRLRELDAEEVETVKSLTTRILWGLLGVSVIVIAAAVLLRWGDLMQSMDGYSSPMAAGIGLLIVQLMFAPSILFSVLSWVAGAGVSMGAPGTSSAFVSVQGPVPDVPALHLLVGDYPTWTMAAPALLVVLGLVTVVASRVFAHRVMEASWTGIGVGLLAVWMILECFALFSGGAMGPLGLSAVGPSALTSALAIVVCLGVGAVIGLGLTKLSGWQSEVNEEA